MLFRSVFSEKIYLNINYFYDINLKESSEQKIFLLDELIRKCTIMKSLPKNENVGNSILETTEIYFLKNMKTRLLYRCPLYR